MVEDRFDTAYIDRALYVWENIKRIHHLDDEVIARGNLILEQAAIDSRLKKERKPNS